MKKITMLLAAAIAMSLVFTSCGNKEEKTDTAGTDTSKTITKADLLDAIVIRHKVADFAKWKAAYDKDDSARLAAGIHSFVIARDVEDSNMIMVSMRIEDTAKARKFGSDPRLKKVMTDAGVIGEPKMMMVHRVFEDTTTNNILQRQMMVIKVKDYEAWRKVFESDKQQRSDSGIKDRIIAQDINDKNTVVLFFAITDDAKAKAFGQSKAVQDKMKEGGVIGQPEMFSYTVVQRY